MLRRVVVDPEAPAPGPTAAAGSPVVWLDYLLARLVALSPVELLVDTREVGDPDDLDEHVTWRFLCPDGSEEDLSCRVRHLRPILAAWGAQVLGGQLYAGHDDVVLVVGAEEHSCRVFLCNGSGPGGFWLRAYVVPRTRSGS